MSLSLSVLPVSEPRIYKFDYRSLMPTQSGSLWQIESGLVRSLTWLEDGTIVALGLWGAGDVVGNYLTKVDPYQLECLTKVEAVPLLPDSLHTMGNLLLNHIQRSEELMVIRSYKRADVMLLKLLSWLAKRFGSQVERGQLIDLRLTHQDLSELLGITRVTITRILSQLEQQGFIQRLSLQRIILKQEEFWHYEI